MRLPEILPLDDAPQPAARRYFDAHVHPWPARLYAAIVDWFERNAWPIAERYDGSGVDAFLASRGVERYAALIYAHKAGLARDLNRWMAEYGRAHPRAVPLGTVHPEDDVAAVVEEAIGPLGLRGLKLHAHVMGFAPDHPALFPAYEILSQAGLPLVFHAGSEPASPAYPRPCDEVSGLARLAKVLARFPELRCLLPHLGASEYELAARLLEEYPNLMLDSTMVLARYFPGSPGPDWVAERTDRILYGTDFPILPYDYDRERRCILAMGLGEEAEDAIFWRNAERFFSPPTARSVDSSG